jgi:septum formation topological specificity factor MinE
MEFEGTSLLASVSPRSILLDTPSRQGEVENDRDLVANDILQFISIPIEIDPEQSEVSLEDAQLVLVLPVSTTTPRSA